MLRVALAFYGSLGVGGGTTSWRATTCITQEPKARSCPKFYLAVRGRLGCLKLPTIS